MGFNLPNNILYPTGIVAITENNFVDNTQDYLSEILDIQLLEGLSFQIIWKGGTNINATITLEASNNCKDFSLIDASEVDISGISGSHIYSIWHFGYRFMRIRITINNNSNSFFDIWANSKKIDRNV